MNENQLRKKIIALCLQMNATGLNQGTSGNISARFNEFMLITPSGIPYEDLKPADIAKMKVDTDEFKWSGPSKPSSEWHFHRAILQDKPEIHAVVHTHSNFATVVSIARDAIPACHYMIAAFGGTTVRCADYETFGTPELSQSILTAMQDRTACLLANHGMVVGGKNLDNAMWAAVELETLSRQYYYAKLAGGMTVLPDAEMATVLEKFKSYGQVQKVNKKRANKAAVSTARSAKSTTTQMKAKKISSRTRVSKPATKLVSKKAIAKKQSARKGSAKRI